MKKSIFATLLFTVCYSVSFGNTIQLFAQGASEYHTGLIQDDLVSLKILAVDYLAHQVKCNSINIKLQIKEGSLFNDNNYAVQGTANCPGVIVGEIKVKIDSGGAGSKMILKLQTENQQIVTKTFSVASKGE